MTVDAFLAALNHPCKPEILALRKVILSADPSITESIKWNSPSFRTREYFATFHLRAKLGVQIILHLGAKKRDDARANTTLPDPTALLHWLGQDRASIEFRDMHDVLAKQAAFTDIIRHWIKYVK